MKLLNKSRLLSSEVLLISFLSKKKELIVLNKTDLVNKNEVKKIVSYFSKNSKNEIIAMSTLDKKSITKIKAKLITYAS